jgi:hypothetical protein
MKRPSKPPESLICDFFLDVVNYEGKLPRDRLKHYSRFPERFNNKRARSMYLGMLYCDFDSIDLTPLTPHFRQLVSVVAMRFGRPLSGTIFVKDDMPVIVA